ncbi:ribosome maturation factor RimM [Candidatus Symbiobacter mobilis]|uniref:Ribosome maturation factor RimM n=1 Tax=Candidatus Symbiobacter mobilis CR TaxID=946483 RepID=U5N953_9BURK|nr:ribosome maturation factor RimM [Candidatus Symbiobacter mobilis]AGX87912.1 small subunit rRNA processing protein RimM [Candidatus Symbiobacter mobilis CR]
MFPPVAPTATGECNAPAQWPEDLVEVARVQGAWGVRGWLRLVAHSPEPVALLAASRWYYTYSACRNAPLPADGNDEQRVRGVWSVRQSRRHSGNVVADIEGIVDRTMAQSWAGAVVAVRKADFPRLGNDEYYLVDLIGMRVQNRQGVYLGSVAKFFPTGPHWVLVLDGERSRMVPFVSAYVDTVDTALRSIVVDWHPDD